MNARFRAAGDKGTRFVHTLERLRPCGRAHADRHSGELPAAPDGSIALPEVLQPYMGGLAAIGADG